jgi:PAS domain S-box-containing protein
MAATEDTRLNLNTLLKDEPHLRQIFQNIEHVVWILDIKTDHIVFASPSFMNVWGRSCESLTADSSILIESVHPEDRVQVLVSWASKDNKPVIQVYRILRPDGSLRWILAHTFLIYDMSGEAQYLFCIAQDITEQKRVEQTLNRTLDRTHEQFNINRRMSLARKPDAVLNTLMSAYELRPAYRASLLFFDNPKAGPSCGIELRGVWTSSHKLPTWLDEANMYEEPVMWELLKPKQTLLITDIRSDSRIIAPIIDILLKEKIRTMVAFPLVALGEWIGCLMVYYQREHHFDPIELRHLKVLVDQATITLYNLKLLDVEEISRRGAEHASKIKTEFLAMISHELRSPLTSILGFSTTLLADDVRWEAEEKHEFIETIQMEANRLQELIDQLLDLSRLEAGMLPISLEKVSIQDILGDAQPQINTLTSGHTLQIHIFDNLPLINADVKRISQVLVNLVRNSAAYAPRGTEISISASLQRSFVRINVTDHGPGIPLDEHKNVFKAFKRGKKGENGSVQGTGLGLAICKALVEAHGGRIWINRKSTPGTTISFTIPCVAVPIPKKQMEALR